MEATSYNQETLALEIGVPQSSISRMLNGKVTPSVRTIVNLAYVLDYPINLLLDTHELIE